MIAEVTIPVVDENLLSDEELSTLSDRQLVELIEKRSNLRGDAASEALTILRDQIPADEDF